MAAGLFGTHTVSAALGLAQARIFKLLVVLSALLSWVMASGAASASLLQHLYGAWQLEKSASMMLYLPPDADPLALQRLQTTLPTLVGVEQVAVVSQSTLQSWLGPVLPDVSNLPLPTVVEIKIAPGTEIEPLEMTLHETFPTAEIDDHSPLLAQARQWVRSLQLAALAVGAAMLVLLGLVIGLTVRTGLQAEQPAVALLLQLGATDGTLQRALVWQVCQRVLGGAVVGVAAAAGMLGVAALVNPLVMQQLSYVTWLWLASPLGIAPLLAGTVAWVTAQQLLRRLG
jgi:cell division transport system permease protein